MKKLLLFVFLLFFVCAYSAPPSSIVCPSSSVLYVDSSIAASGDGTSWGTAYKTVWEALTIANSCTGVNEIWVKKGTYYPMTSSTTKATSRDSSFRILRNGIKLYGGFAGTETALSARDYTLNPTILSGDIGTTDDSTDNSYHVMTIIAPDATTLDTSTMVDGFTISGANANGSYFVFSSTLNLINSDGGGILNVASDTGIQCSPLIQNSIIIHNHANVGGGFYSRGSTGGISSPSFRNCTFEQNDATDVGALHAYSDNGGQSTPKAYNCIFKNNKAARGGAFGAYGYTGTAAPEYFDCVFEANTASNNGGVAYTYRGTISVSNSVFESNTTTGSSGSGGAIFNGGSNTTILKSCTFNNNTTASTSTPNSNAIYSAGNLYLTNTIVWGAAANQLVATGTSTYVYSLVKGLGLSSPGLDIDPIFVDAANPKGVDGVWATADDGLRLRFNSPAINKGNNDSVSSIATDIIGATRIQASVVDMGAYEGGVMVCPTDSILYVDSSIASSGLGNSWAAAYKTVWEALTVANACTSVKQIWVKKGTYYPMISSITITTNRDSSFRITRNGVKIYGGFAGTETILSDRSVSTNPTVLSADIGVTDDSTDNCYHVMTILATSASQIDSNTVVDGFTITRGNAQFGGSFTYNGLTFNRQDGAGIYNWGLGSGNKSNPLIANCSFTRNAANFGGAIYNSAFVSGSDASPILRNDSFVSNKANYYGGGIFNNGAGGNSSPLIEGCSFTGNAAVNGGGVHNYGTGSGNSSSIFRNCIFTKNSASDLGGASYLQGFGNISYTNVTFDSNSAANYGGAVFNNGVGSSVITLSTCRFSGNSSGRNGGAMLSNSGLINISNTVFYGNTAKNTYSGTGGGGALLCEGSNTTSLTNCVLANNTAAGTAANGGGALLLLGGTAKMLNTTMFGNTTASTVVANANTIGSSASTTLYLTNSIVWGAVANHIAAAGTTTYTHSLVKGLALASPSLSVDPLFLNSADPKGTDGVWATSDDGLQLSACSKAINAAINDSIATITTDIIGNNRKYVSIADMGAYEFQSTPATHYNDTITTAICNGDSILFNGVYYKAAIVHTDSFLTAAGCDSIKTLKLSVNSLPSAPTVSSSIINYCQGVSTSVLSATKSGTSDTLKWYTTAIAGTASATAPSPSAAMPGVLYYYVSEVNTLGCESPRTPIQVNINPKPDSVKATALSATTFCVGDSVILQGSSKVYEGFGTTAFLQGTLGSGTTKLCDCPNGSVAVGYEGRSAAWIDQFNLICKPIDRFGVLGSTTSVTLTSGTSTGGAYRGPYLFTGTGMLVGVNSKSEYYSSTSPGRFNGEVTGFGQLQSYINGYGDNTTGASSLTKIPAWAVYADLGTVWAPDGSVFTGMTSYTTGASSGFAMRYTPIGAFKYTYSWSSAPTTDTNSALLVKTSGSYTLTVTNSLGCSATSAPVNVTVNALPTITGTLTACVSRTSTLTGSATAHASTPWRSSNTAVATVSSGGVVTGISPGTCTITYMNSNGCEKAVTFTVNPMPAASLSVADTSGTTNNDGVICAGAYVTMTASGGTSYLWNTGATTAAITVSPSSTTTYTVTITNAYGCDSVKKQTVTVNPLPTPSVAVAETSGAVNNDGIICDGASVTITASGGTSYVWSTGATTAAITVSPASTATYTVTVFNANNCSAMKSQTITVNPVPSAPTVTSPLQYCNFDTASTLVAMGTDLLWYDAAVGGIGSTDVPRPSTDTVGTKSFFVSQTLIGCESPRAEIVVMTHPNPSLTMVPYTNIDFVFCPGLDVTIKANSDTGVSYRWYKSSSLLASDTTDSLIVNTAAYYTVRVTNKYGCEKSATKYIWKDSTKAPILSPTDVWMCPGTIVRLYAKPYSSNFKYQWFQNGSLMSTSVDTVSEQDITDAGLYKVVITNQYGCVLNTNTAAVNLYPAIPKVVITRADPYLRVPSALGSYQWYRNYKPIAGATTNTYEMKFDGTYYVKVFDKNGCEAYSDTIQVEKLGINYTAQSSNIKIYPNPAQNRVYLEAAIQLNVVVCDITGRKIYQDNDVKYVDLGDFADGNYLFRIYDENNQLITIQKIAKSTER